MDDLSARLRALLAPLTDHERRRTAQPGWSLEKTRELLQRPGARLGGGQAVQVGGSKGKGTTSLYLESLAAAAGLRTGTYTSPHLESLLERIRIGGHPITEAELLGVLEPILDFAGERGLDISFFEAMTTAAVASFAAAGVELAIYEVGLGARLDATTAVPVDASILTSVELEHTELLGDTVEAIAAEKAHVVRPGGTAFTALQGPALGVVTAHAAAVGARLQVLGRDFALTDVTPLAGGTDGGLAGTLIGVGPVPRRFRVPGASAFELPALALAAACLHWLHPERELCLDPVPRPFLPGRCEIVPCPDGDPLVLDAAHTESSVRALAVELQRRYPGQRLTVLFASSAGKRWRESLKWLLPLADTFLVTALTETTTEQPDAVLAWLQAQGVVGAETVDTVPLGLQRLFAVHGGVRLVTGSFYLVGEARRCLRRLGLHGMATT